MANRHGKANAGIRLDDDNDAEPVVGLRHQRLVLPPLLRTSRASGHSATEPGVAAEGEKKNEPVADRHLFGGITDRPRGFQIIRGRATVIPSFDALLSRLRTMARTHRAVGTALARGTSDAEKSPRTVTVFACGSDHRQNSGWSRLTANPTGSGLSAERVHLDAAKPPALADGQFDTVTACGRHTYHLNTVSESRRIIYTGASSAAQLRRSAA